VRPERWRQVDEILQAAFDRAPRDRGAFLDHACAGDADLRREVEALLASDKQADSFIEAPAVQVAAPLLVGQAARFMAGQSIGHYQVISLLGKGGMGEVYLARDGRLGRQVALKFLPLELAADPGRMRRFEHEARAASALNHPHVATIYELGEADGQRFIAMEYVAGETLAARLRDRRLDLQEVSGIALQIAEALEEAHGKAIIHRDINPANVMLTAHAQVKVLDFGLAKVRVAEQGQRPLTATTPGLVVGTAPYMSPEQARGQEVDHRSDIFSFGAVLYEMATGRVAFKGRSQAETMNAVINVPHTPAREVHRDIPPRLAALIDRALMKDAASRYQSMTELLADLRQVVQAPVTRVRRSSRLLGAWSAVSRFRPASAPGRLAASALLVTLATVLAYFAIWYTGRRGAVPPSGQRALTRLTFDAGLQGEPTWSPDGRFIAYSSDKSGNFDIWVQPVGGGDAVQVTKSPAHDWQPDWSPDGNQIVFRSERDGGGLFVVPVLGGRERRVSPFGYRPHWSPDGTKLLFLRAPSTVATNANFYAKLYAASLDGGAPQEVQAELFRDFLSVSSAVWHPDGERISLIGESRRAGPGFWTVPLAGGTAVKSEPNEELEEHFWDEVWMGSDVRWAPSGRAVYFAGFSRGVRNLWKISVDPLTLRWIARPERLTTGFNDSDSALSPDGRRLAYTVRRESTRAWSFPFDPRAGKVNGAATAVTATDIDPVGLGLSPDGRQLLYVAGRTGSNKAELVAKSLVDNREISPTVNDQLILTAIWSRDGRRIAYLGRCRACTGRDDLSVFVLPAAGGKEAVVASGAEDLTWDWSADGQWLLVTSARDSPRRWGVLAMYPLSAAPHADARRRVITSHPEHSLFGARLSPDDRWICFQATKGGAQAVLYVVPASGGDWTRISEDNVWSDKPRWSPDGTTIYYISNRESGFFNVWGQRFDPTRGQPAGQPFRVTSFDSPGRMLWPNPGSEIPLDTERLLIPITEVTGSIWVLDNVDR